MIATVQVDALDNLSLLGLLALSLRMVMAKPGDISHFPDEWENYPYFLAFMVFLILACFAFGAILLDVCALISWIYNKAVAACCGRPYYGEMPSIAVSIKTFVTDAGDFCVNAYRFVTAAATGKENDEAKPLIPLDVHVAPIFDQRDHRTGMVTPGHKMYNALDCGTDSLPYEDEPQSSSESVI